MHTDIINEHLDKEVEVTTSAGKMFSGNLKHNDSARDVVVLEPNDRYDAKRFGNTYVSRNDIVTIRERLPQVEEEEAMDKYVGDSDSAYDSKSPYVDSSESKALKNAARALEDLKKLKKMKETQSQTTDPLLGHDTGVDWEKNKTF